MRLYIDLRKLYFPQLSLKKTSKLTPKLKLNLKTVSIVFENT